MKKNTKRSLVQKLPNKKPLSYLEKINIQWKVCKMDSAPTKTVKILKLIWRKVSFYLVNFYTFLT